MEKQKPNAELRAKDIDIIRDINAVDFVLTGLTDSGLIRSVRIETALLRQTDNGVNREINLRKLQQETRIVGTSFRSLINRPFQKNGWIVRKEGSYFLTDEGLKHAKESREELSQAIVKNFRRIPPLNQLPLYNAFRLVSVGITGSLELMDLSFMVDLVGTFEYALEVLLCGKVYIPGQAIFLRAVKEAGRTTCSECSVYVPYKSRQSVKFMMQRLKATQYPSTATWKSRKKGRSTWKGSSERLSTGTISSGSTSRMQKISGRLKPGLSIWQTWAYRASTQSGSMRLAANSQFT